MLVLPPFTHYHPQSNHSSCLKRSSILIISSQMKSQVQNFLLINRLADKTNMRNHKVNDDNAHLLVHFDTKMAKLKRQNPMLLPLYYSLNRIQNVELLNRLPYQVDLTIIPFALHHTSHPLNTRNL